ncbi:hypothetical protein [Bacillus sp. EB01]|uniref:hypothetical protein n=1 Tax=Bacillus sp. EB01 TaxID=1347086 RepID=UPI0005C6FF55|nr:hypothetical protein [Bacillus sp. EB01]
MNKKAIAIAASLGILFAGAGSYKILAGSAGYDAYKEAMKKIHTIDNATMEIDMTITDNGKLLLSSDSSMKFDKDSDLAAGTVTVNNSSQTLKMNGFLENGRPVIQSEGGAYYIPEGVEHPSMNLKEGETFHDPEMLKLGELIIDAVAQPVQGEFEQKGNTIIIDMNKDDFPNIIHTIGKQVIKLGFKAHSDIELTPAEYPFLSESFTSQLPKLEEEISIEKAYVKVKLTDEGLIKSQDAIFKIKGKDALGVQHKIEITMDLAVKSVGSTTVERLDLTGKDIKEFEMKKIH